ncbi:hypothetical protein GWI33_008093 [Rhynchophorus ferrugineus]|uniref:Mos1 transposase HTH domain-containing protein n=1 Tax=Rhynchophorus ferrugineus TaxID=354439 RepID=A0A834ICH7_RHYFE|nr:hypothetical protein GWI33_008093 [Rhynchophorus ferrugineus]
MDQKQFRVLILHYFLIGKNTVQAKQWLEKYYRDLVPSETTIKRWFADFKRGRRDTDDAERNGRPNEVVAPENIEKIRKIVLNDRKARISKERVDFILYELLTLTKLCSKWVPRLFTVDQKQERVDDSEQCLAIFKRNQPTGMFMSICDSV